VVAGVVVAAACGARAEVSAGQATRESTRLNRIALWYISLPPDLLPFGDVLIPK